MPNVFILSSHVGSIREVDMPGQEKLYVAVDSKGNLVDHVLYKQEKHALTALADYEGVSLQHIGIDK